MSNEKRYKSRNRITGRESKRTYTSAEVAKMQKNPIYKGLNFIEVRPPAVPSTLTKVTKSKGTDAGNNDNTGTAIEPDRAVPGSDNDSNTNG